MFCKKCGLKLGADNIFCHGCGYKIDTNNTVEEIKIEETQKKTMQKEVQRETKNEKIEERENIIKEEESIASQSNIKNSANLWEFLCDAWHGRKMVLEIFFKLYLPLTLLILIIGFMIGGILGEYDDTLLIASIIFDTLSLPLRIFIFKCFWSCSSNVKYQKLKYGGKLFAIIVAGFAIFQYLVELDRFLQ